jgi:hypothetical protein
MTHFNLYFNIDAQIFSSVRACTCPRTHIHRESQRDRESAIKDKRRAFIHQSLNILKKIGKSLFLVITAKDKQNFSSIMSVVGVMMGSSSVSYLV